MRKDEPLLHVGMADFAEPTLLIVGDAESLVWLADYIDTQQPIRFAALSPSVRLVNVDLRLAPSDAGGSLHRSGSVLDWKVSSVEARQFAEQLRTLAASESPAHTYLDTESNNAGVEIVVSKGEYDPSAVFIS